MESRNDPSPRLKKLKLLIYLIYCCEAGLFLIIAPWHSLWDTNVFFDLVPGARDILLSGWARGAISGLGVLHLMLFVADLINLRLVLEEI